MMGPGMAYGLGGLMLRLYVDIDRMPEGEPQECTVVPRGTQMLASCSLITGFIGDTEPGDSGSNPSNPADLGHGS